MYLDKTKKDSKIYVASNISIDVLEYTLKVYSYSKIGDGKYFEMGFKFDNPIYKELKQSADEIYALTHNKISLYRVIATSDKRYLYYNDLLNKPAQNISKQKFLESVKKFDINKPTDDPIIKTIREKSIQKEIIKDKYVVYVPLLQKDKNKYLFYNNIVMKIEIDISSYLQSLHNIKKMFLILGFLLFVFIALLYYFIRFHFYKPMSKIIKAMELEKKIEDKELIEKKDEFGILAEKYNKLYDSLSKEIEKNAQLLNA